MDAETSRALNAINGAFYRDHAASFDAARQDPWPGWTRVLERLDRDGPPGPWAILDVGCGNGRLAGFLDLELARRRESFRYLGIDASEPLLERARMRSLAAGKLRVSRADWVESPPEAALPAGRFSLVALFGVLNHVPGAERRQSLLQAAARRLAAGGLLVWTVWGFDAHRRFRRRMVSWSEHNRRAARPIVSERLEPGDRLLRWGTAPDGPTRYFHVVEEGENEELVSLLGLERLDSFRSDGREGDLNRYQVLRAARSDRPGAPGQAVGRGG